MIGAAPDVVLVDDVERSDDANAYRKLRSQTAPTPAATAASIGWRAWLRGAGPSVRPRGARADAGMPIVPDKAYVALLVRLTCPDLVKAINPTYLADSVGRLAQTLTRWPCAHRFCRPYIAANVQLG